MRLTHAALPAALTLIGCGGAVYQPRPSPRIQVVQDSGLAFTKNGRTYAIGLFGGDLEEMVRGNPRATEEAESFRNKSIAGFVIGIGGSVAAGVGAGLVAYNEAESRTSDLRIAGLSLAIGGVVLAIVSATVTASAQKHIWNAINIHNDELPPPWGFGPPARAPLGAQPGYAPMGAQPGYAPMGAQPGYAPMGAQPGYAPMGAQPGYAPMGAPPAYAPPAVAPPPAPASPPAPAPPQ